MSTRITPVVRGLRLAGFLGMAVALVACAPTGSPGATATPAPTPVPLLRLENGTVQVQEAGAGWRPVAGESTFELAGELESLDPWIVTGNSFAARSTTQIAEGLEVGDPVRVSGFILEDQTWLANSIELAAGEEHQDPGLILTGKVNSRDPWVVHRITLDVTGDTQITGEVAPDGIAVVEILLMEGGTWKVMGIAPLSAFTEIPGCATVTATVANVNEDEVQFTDWPAIPLGEKVTIENESGEAVGLAANQMVLVVVCEPGDGEFTITKIIVLDETPEGVSVNRENVLLCHKPYTEGRHPTGGAAAATHEDRADISREQYG